MDPSIKVKEEPENFSQTYEENYNENTHSGQYYEENYVEYYAMTFFSNPHDGEICKNY